MNRLTSLLIVLALAAGTQFVVAQQTPEADRIFARAQQKETVAGDLPGAIEDYKAVVAAARSNRPLAAQALLRMAECYQKFDDAEAQKVYAQIVRDFGDQKDAVLVANARLVRPPSATADAAPRRICAACVGAKLRSFSLSPDGRWIGYTGGGGPGITGNDDLMIRDLTTGEVTVLVDVPQTSSGRFAAREATWSPDMQQIAYFYRDRETPGLGDRSQLRVVARRPGSEPHTLVDNPDFTYILPTAWSPDGKSILVMTMRRDLTWQLAWVSAATGDITMLKSLNWQFNEFGNGPALSPDGRFVAYGTFTRPRSSASDPGTSDMTLHILPSDGSANETSVAGVIASGSFPVWAADGSRVFFVSDRVTGRSDLFSIPIRQGQVAGAPALVRSGIESARLVGVTRTDQLHYVLLSASYNRTLVQEIGDNPSTSAPSALARFGNLPTWSADGRRLASSVGNQVVVRDLESETERAYSLGTPTSLLRPQWLHSGSALVVPSFEEGRVLLLSLDLRTSAVRRLTHLDGNGNPLDPRAMFSARARSDIAVSPDDKTVYFGAGTNVNSRRDRLVSVDLASGQASEVTTVPASIAGLAVGSNGGTLAISLVDGPVPPNAVGFSRLGTTARIAVINADGSGYRSLYGPVEGRTVPGTSSMFSRLSEPVWSRDGRSILFGQQEDDGGWTIWRVRPEGGQPEPVGTMASADVKNNGGLPSGSPGFTVSADGTRAAHAGFATVRSASELWVLDVSPRSSQGR